MKTSVEQPLMLKNTGATALSITGLAIAGTNAADFKLTPASTCGSSLAAGSQCSIYVTFTPSATGTRTATLTVTDNALPGKQVLALSGTGK